MQNITNKNILLIYPPYFRLLGEYRIWYPLGLGYIASYLNSYGHQVSVYNADSCVKSYENVISYRKKFYESEKILLSANDDNNSIWIELKDVLDKKNPDVIGISILTETIPLINKIIRICKEFNERVPIILGGPHVSVDVNSLSQIENWDYALIGEAEKNFLTLINNIFSNTPIIKNINGIVIKKNEGIRVHGTSEIFRDHLDKLPFPNIGDLYQIGTSPSERIKKTMISTSRGCIFKCTFCYMNSSKEKMRFRTPQSVIDEIEFNIDNYKVKNFYFIDDSFGVNKNFLKEFSHLINEKDLEIKWSCMTHESLINENTLKLMKNSGCDSIHVGIESGSNRILRLIHKKTTTEKIIKKCELLEDFGIKLKAFFMFGLPSEREEDLQNSIDFLKKINPYEAILQPYIPYPNTELWNYIKREYGDPSNFYDWNQFHKSKVNYSLFPDITPCKFDKFVDNFFSVVEDINTNNHIY